MELSQIRYFLEVARTQHMTKSAEKLHIAQPALSQAIRRLEKSLGVPLFLPKGRGIVLTEYGRFLYKKLEPIMEQLDGLPAQLREMAQTENETVHLRVLAASSLVTEAIIEYESLGYELNFQLTQSTDDEVYDLEITTKMSYQVRPENANDQFVCAEKIYLAVPNRGKYAGRRSITLAEVADEGFISLMGSIQFRSICDKFCHRAGIEPRVILESDSPSTVRNMIAANLGVGFWPEYTWGDVVHDRVRLLEITDPLCSRDIVIIRRRNKVDNSHVEDFFEFLKQFFLQRSRENIVPVESVSQA